MRTPSKLSPGLIAVLLVTREHSRLSGQIKSLDKLLQAPYSDKEYQRLQTMSANWRALLAHDGAAKLADQRAGRVAPMDMAAIKTEGRARRRRSRVPDTAALKKTGQALDEALCAHTVDVEDVVAEFKAARKRTPSECVGPT